MESTEKAESPAESARDQAVREARERLGPKFAEAEKRLLKVNDQVQDFVRQNPGTCLLGAAALGFLVGRWAARR